MERPFPHTFFYTTSFSLWRLFGIFPVYFEKDGWIGVESMYERPIKTRQKTGKTNYVQIHVIGISCSISYFILYACMDFFSWNRQWKLGFFNLAERNISSSHSLAASFFLWNTVRKMHSVEMCEFFPRDFFAKISSN